MSKNSTLHLVTRQMFHSYIHLLASEPDSWLGIFTACHRSSGPSPLHVTDVRPFVGGSDHSSFAVHETRSVRVTYTTVGLECKWIAERRRWTVGESTRYVHACRWRVFFRWFWRASDRLWPVNDAAVGYICGVAWGWIHVEPFQLLYTATRLKAFINHEHLEECNTN